jgi:hypothetical protein
MLSGEQAAKLFEQMAVCDEIMRRKGWNPRVAREVADTLGVCLKTAYTIRSRVIRWTQRHLRPQDIDARRAEQYQLVDAAAREALANRDYAAVASLMKVAASLTGTNAPTKVDVTSTTRLDVSPAVVDLVSQRLALASTPRPTLIEAQAEVLEAAVSDS